MLNKGVGNDKFKVFICAHIYTHFLYEWQIEKQNILWKKKMRKKLTNSFPSENIY